MILLLVQYAMERRIRVFRIALASILGAVMATFVLWLPIGFGISYFIIMLGTALVMCYIVESCTSQKDFVMGAMWYVMLSLIFTWLLEVVTRFGSRSIGIGSIVLAFLLIGGVLVYVRHHRKEKAAEVVYRAQIREKGKCVEAKALFDTGNSLKEPFSKRPVSIVEQGLVDEIWKEKEVVGKKIIPFHSIGTKHGMLQGMEVEELVIWKEDRKIIWKQAIIAVYDGNLSQDGSFRMILHPELDG